MDERFFFFLSTTNNDKEVAKCQINLAPAPTNKVSDQLKDSGAARHRIPCNQNPSSLLILLLVLT